MKNIVLVGFMGTGKTEVAKALAHDLGKKYVSIDEEIEKNENKVIKDIFKDNGEAYFRDVEKRILTEVLESSDQIIDTGGGVVLDEENIRNMKNNGLMVCLWADPEIVYERTSKQGHRPLLNVENPLDRIKELLEYRRPFYKKADIEVDTTNIDIDEVTRKVKEAIYE